jgi:hypothetical protein
MGAKKGGTVAMGSVLYNGVMEGGRRGAAGMVPHGGAWRGA